METTFELAYTGVIDKGNHTIGIARRGVRGWCPTFEQYTSYDAARDEATRRNRIMGLTDIEAWKIVASSM